MHGSRKTSFAQFIEGSVSLRRKCTKPYCLGTDANAHHITWGSSDINPRGEDLLAYCASADLNFRDVGNKPTFRTKTREEVLDLTLVNRCAGDRVVGWHVSNVPSFSDHMYEGQLINKVNFLVQGLIIQIEA